MKKKLTRCLIPVLFLVSSVVLANNCPDPSDIIWQTNHWQSKDGFYWGIGEYSAGSNATPTSFDNVFWKNLPNSEYGPTVCTYHTNLSNQYIEMMHWLNDTAKPIDPNWVVTPPPGWHGNLGLVCRAGLDACNFTG